MNQRSPVLLVSHDPNLARAIGRALNATAEAVLQPVAGVEEAVQIIGQESVGLVVLHLRAGPYLRACDQLLWACTRAARPIPLVVIAERYRADQALTLFRMGVSDYLSRSDHLHQLPLLLTGLVHDRADAAFDGAIQGIDFSGERSFPSAATVAKRK